MAVRTKKSWREKYSMVISKAKSENNRRTFPEYKTETKQTHAPTQQKEAL